MLGIGLTTVAQSPLTESVAAAPRVFTLGATAASPNSASVTVTAGPAGALVYLYVSLSATPPSQSDLVGANGALWNASIVAGDPAPDITGLVASTTYYLHALVDNAGELSDVVSASFVTQSAGDTTAPILASLTTDDTVSPLAISFDLTEDSGLADIFWVLVPSGASAPSNIEIAAGQASGGGSPAAGGSLPAVATVTEALRTTPIATGLAGLYDFYLVARDAAGNVSNVLSDAGLSIDTTAPVPSITGVTAGNGQLNVAWTTDTDEGPARIVAVPNGATAPSTAEILAGQASGGGAPSSDSGSITVTATGAQTAVDITGLTNGTAYDVYLAHQDATGAPNSSAVSSDNHAPVAAGFSENQVRFDSSDSYLHHAANEWIPHGLICFFSFERPTADDWRTLFHNSTSGSRGFASWDNSDNFRVQFEDQNQTDYDTGYLAVPDWTGTGRLSMIATVEVATGAMRVMSKVDGNPWRTFYDNDNARPDGTIVFLDAFTIGSRTTLDAGSFAGHDLYRLALWEVVSPNPIPDVSQAAVQANFMNGHVLEDPAVSVAAYGTPHLDLNGNAAAHAAGTHDGDWGTLSVGGTFTDQ